MKRLIYLVLLVGALASSASGQVRPLDETTVTAAIAEGRKRAPLYDPLLIRAQSLMMPSVRAEMTKEMRDAEAFAATIESAPFRLLIQTPYSSVAGLAAEAARRHQDFAAPPLEAVNHGVTLDVAPGPSITTADAVENVVLRRDGQIIKPLKSHVEPATVQTAMGARRELSQGQFLFPMDPFAPTAALTIVVIGRTGNWEWTMTPRELAVLK